MPTELGSPIFKGRETSLDTASVIMLVGECPFYGSNFVELQTQVQKVNPYYNAEVIPRKAIKLLEIVLVKDPKKRATWSQIFKKSWFRQGGFKPVRIKKLQSSSRSVVDIQLEKGVSESVVERELDESEGSDFSVASQKKNYQRPLMLIL